MKKNNLIKRVSLFGLAVIGLLIVAMILQSKHIATIVNHDVSFEGNSLRLTTTRTNPNQRIDLNKGIEIPPTTWMDDDVAKGAEFDGGNGTPESPFLISTPEQLGYMAHQINHTSFGEMHKASYKLTKDIDLKGRAWLAVGRDGTTGDGGRFFGGNFDGDGHIIDNMLAINKQDFSNGRTSGFFGAVSNDATITNIIFTNALATLDPSVDLDDDDDYSTVHIAIVVAEIPRDQNAYMGAIYVVDSAIVTPSTNFMLFGYDVVDGVKAGTFVGYQAPGKGMVGLSNVNAIGMVLAIIMYLDFDWWEMGDNIVIHCVGGIAGQVGHIEIEDSSFDGSVTVHATRIDRNLDNWRMIFALGGAIGQIYNDTNEDKNVYQSKIYGVTVAASLNINTFDPVDARGMLQNSGRATEKVADVRYVGGVIGDIRADFNTGTSNSQTYNRATMELIDVQATVLVDAPNGDEIKGGNQGGAEEDSSRFMEQAQDLAKKIKTETSQYNKEIAKNRFSMSKKDSKNSQTRVWPFAWSATLVINPATASGASAAAVSTWSAVSAWAASALGAASAILLVVAIILIILVVIAIIVLAILFAIWGISKPKWKSVIHIGSAIGSDGRMEVHLDNVQVANSAVHYNTLFSQNDGGAFVENSSNTLPTMAMIIDQPTLENPVQNIGDVASMSVSGHGTTMADGSDGVNSFLTYQWFYNTIDKNEITDDTVIVEGANTDSFSIEVDWVGSRYYFATVTNNVLDFHGSFPTVTARVGSRDISLSPATIVKQPQDTTVTVNRAGTLTVKAESSASMSYQWYVSQNRDMEDRILLSGATDETYYPVHSIVGEYFYQVVVLTTVVATTGETIRAETSSAVVTVTVEARATQVDIAVQPRSASGEDAVHKGQTVVLGVEVDLSTVNGELTYQWYKNSQLSTDGATALTDEAYEGQYTSQSLLVDTREDGTSYYFVVVTNTVEISKTTATSTIAEVKVLKNPVANIEIIHEPVNTTVNIGTSFSLNVGVVSNGVINYQWFKNNINSTQGGTQVVEGGKTPSYTVHANEVGTYYYYAKISAKADLLDEDTKNSVVVRVDVVDPNQRALNIVGTSKDAKIAQGNSETLKVSVEDRKGSMSYQWYEATKADGSDAKAIFGAVGSIYKITGKDVGIKYYFVEAYNAVDIKTQQNGKTKAILHVNKASTLSNTQLSPIKVEVVKVKGNFLGVNNSSSGLLWGILGGSALIVVLSAAVILAIKISKKNKQSMDSYDSYTSYYRNRR
ncbi:MAG: hypothetical protein FWF56_05230 [Firmicutes bacterium]|nr:hypothetical protein [Bacillota bacterium]MCL1953647.1 hypothetical protein [Bacillota bacterium]